MLVSRVTLVHCGMKWYEINMQSIHRHKPLSHELGSDWASEETNECSGAHEQRRVSENRSLNKNFLIVAFQKLVLGQQTTECTRVEQRSTSITPWLPTLAHAKGNAKWRPFAKVWIIYFKLTPQLLSLRYKRVLSPYHRRHILYMLIWESFSTLRC